MRITVIALALLTVASMAVAANSGLTYTVTKVGAYHNANGSTIVCQPTGIVLDASNTLYDVCVYTSDPTGSTTGSWALNITTTATGNSTIIQSLGGKYTDTVVNTQADALKYDAPSNPTSANYKNDNYSMYADTWLGNNFALIGSPGIFTPPDVDIDGNVIDAPNEWDLHVGTPAGQDFGNILVGQWCVNWGGSGNLLIQGTIARNGVQYDLGVTTPCPEPVSLSLLGLGSLALLRRRK